MHEADVLIGKQLGCKQMQENQSKLKSLAIDQSIGIDAIYKGSSHPIYLPTQEQIAAECQRFQALWTDVVREKRRRGWQPE